LTFYPISRIQPSRNTENGRAFRQIRSGRHQSQHTDIRTYTQGEEGQAGKKRRKEKEKGGNEVEKKIRPQPRGHPEEKLGKEKK